MVDDIKEVLGIDSKSVSCGQHLLLVILLETEAKKMQKDSFRVRLFAQQMIKFDTLRINRKIYIKEPGNR